MKLDISIDKIAAAFSYHNYRLLMSALKSLTEAVSSIV